MVLPVVGTSLGKGGGVAGGAPLRPQGSGAPGGHLIGLVEAPLLSIVQEPVYYL